MRTGKTILLALALGGACIGQAFSADLMALRPSLPDLPAQDCDFNWTGGYGGIYVGYESVRSRMTELGNGSSDPANCSGGTGTVDPNGNALPAGTYWCNVNGAAHYTGNTALAYNQVGNSWSQTTSSFTGSVAATYLYQFPHTHYVLGAEVEAGSLGNYGISGFAPTTDDTTAGVAATSYGTARLIGGYAFNRFLAYGTAGVAFGNFGNWVQDQDTPVGIRTTPTSTQFGGVIGVGGAYALTDHWIVKGEYLLMDFPGNDTGAKTSGYANLTCFNGIGDAVCTQGSPQYWKTSPLSNPATASFNWKAAQLVNLMHIGVSYKF